MACRGRPPPSSSPRVPASSYLKQPLKVLPSSWACRLELGLGSWCHYGEDHRGQGIDCKTWNLVLLEREGERGWPWRSFLCVETGSDPGAWPFTSEPRGLAPMIFKMFLTSVLGPTISDDPVSTRALQPPEQAITFLFMEMLRDKGRKRASRSLWVYLELPTSQLSHKLPFICCPLFLYSRHSSFLDIFECTTWIHWDLLYLDISRSSFLEKPPPLWLANFFSSCRFHLNCIVFRKVFLRCLSVSYLGHSL